MNLQIEILKSQNPRDFPDRRIAIRTINKLIDEGSVSVEDAKSLLPLLINELDYSYDEFCQRQTRYGEPEAVGTGSYRDKTYQLCRILWMIDDPKSVAKAVEAMSSLLSHLWEESTSKLFATPNKDEVMLLEEMKAGNKYPLDWPKRVADWKVQEKPARDKLNQKVQQQLRGKGKSGCLLVISVVFVLTILIVSFVLILN